MRILILGAAGMVGRKLAERLVRDGALGAEQVSDLTLVDLVKTESAGVEILPADVADHGVAEELVASRPDVVFHLAAVVSGEAEADFEKGYRVNLDGTRLLLDAVRRDPGYCPRVVFASSIAVFGAPFPEAIGDDYCTAPRTSYGTQKAIAELLSVRLHAPRLPRRCGDPAADDLRASGEAEPGGLGLLLQHHSGAVERRGGCVAGSRADASLVCVPALRPSISSCSRPRWKAGRYGRPALADHARCVRDCG